ncbi:hypothetical protein AAHC03_025619 [Spirometra sp. Aus1]
MADDFIETLSLSSVSDPDDEPEYVAEHRLVIPLDEDEVEDRDEKGIEDKPPSLVQLDTSPIDESETQPVLIVRPTGLIHCPLRAASYPSAVYLHCDSSSLPIVPPSALLECAILLRSWLAYGRRLDRPTRTSAMKSPVSLANRTRISLDCASALHWGHLPTRP